MQCPENYRLKACCPNNSSTRNAGAGPVHLQMGGMPCFHRSAPLIFIGSSLKGAAVNFTRHVLVSERCCSRQLNIYIATHGGIHHYKSLLHHPLSSVRLSTIVRHNSLLSIIISLSSAISRCYPSFGRHPPLPSSSICFHYAGTWDTMPLEAA